MQLGEYGLPLYSGASGALAAPSGAFVLRSGFFQMMIQLKSFPGQILKYISFFLWRNCADFSPRNWSHVPCPPLHRSQKEAIHRGARDQWICRWLPGLCRMRRGVASCVLWKYTDHTEEGQMPPDARYPSFSSGCCVTAPQLLLLQCVRSELVAKRGP